MSSEEFSASSSSGSDTASIFYDAPGEPSTTGLGGSVKKSSKKDIKIAALKDSIKKEDPKIITSPTAKFDGKSSVVRNDEKKEDNRSSLAATNGDSSRKDRADSVLKTSTSGDKERKSHHHHHHHHHHHKRHEKSTPASEAEATPAAPAPAPAHAGMPSKTVSASMPVLVVPAETRPGGGSGGGNPVLVPLSASARPRPTAAHAHGLRQLNVPALGGLSTADMRRADSLLVELTPRAKLRATPRTDARSRTSACSSMCVYIRQWLTVRM